jgi:hypothetical protein
MLATSVMIEINNERDTTWNYSRHGQQAGIRHSG